MESGQLIYGLDEINDAIKLLLSFFDKCSVFTFVGDLGAGKTTLIKMLLKEVGVKDIITSPTFAYMCKYKNSQDQSFYHFDLYRMKSATEFFDAGFDELLYRPNSWSFIEWPEIIMPYLNERVCNISIEHFGEDRRLLVYNIM